MDTFSVLLNRDITPEAVANFVETNGGTVISERTGYGSIERGERAVFVGLELPEHRDWDSLAKAPKEVVERVRSVVLVTVSRKCGSKYLAFEVATKAVDRWGGVISWDGLEDWETEYSQWRQNL